MCKIRWETGRIQVAPSGAPYPCHFSAFNRVLTVFPTSDQLRPGASSLLSLALGEEVARQLPLHLHPHPHPTYLAPICSEDYRPEETSPFLRGNKSLLCCIAQYLSPKAHMPPFSRHKPPLGSGQATQTLGSQCANSNSRVLGCRFLCQ